MTDLTPTAGADLLTFTIVADKLRAFTMTELRDLREAMVLVADLLSGQTSQPRYIQPDTCLFNAPGDVLDTLHVLASTIADKVEDEATGRDTGLSDRDGEIRAWLLIRARAERSDDLAKVIQIAADRRTTR